MIFEKPSYKKKTSVLDFIGYTVLVVVMSSYATYAIVMLFGLGGGVLPSSAKFLDFVNGAAQISTAAAFLLAVHQYRKSIRQQRQLAIAGEARSQLIAMVEVSKSIAIEDRTSMRNINDSMASLVGIAVNFYELYDAMEEDLHRAMVRMQWQSMYFGNLLVALTGLDLYSVLRDDLRVSGVDVRNIFIAARRCVEEQGVLPVFEKFKLYEAVLSDPNISAEYSLVGKLDSLDQFVCYFFNRYRLNDLLYGLLNRVDIRAQAPLLAVAKPSNWAFEKH